VLLDSERHWLERYQPLLSTLVAAVVGVLSLLPFVSGMWQRAATAPYIAGGAYLVTTIILDFIIALAITREERRRAPQPKPTKAPKLAPPPPKPDRRAPLPQAFARIRAR
jgi:uncharacterized membrane protein